MGPAGCGGHSSTCQGSPAAVAERQLGITSPVLIYITKEQHWDARQVCLGMISESTRAARGGTQGAAVLLFPSRWEQSWAFGLLQSFSLGELKPSLGRQGKTENSLSEDRALHIPAAPLPGAKPGGDLKREKLETSVISWRLTGLFLFIAEA